MLLAAAVLAVGVLMALARSAHADSIITVNTKDDETTSGDGKCSLREAITNANDNKQTSADCEAGSGADTIVFDPSVSGPIALTEMLPSVSDTAGLTIDGGDNGITISGEGQSRVLQVTPGVGLTLKNLTVANGSASDFGGGVYNQGGTLTVTNSTFSNNSASNGGGIFNQGGTLISDQQHLLGQCGLVRRRHL